MSSCSSIVHAPESSGERQRNAIIDRKMLRGDKACE